MTLFDKLRGLTAGVVHRVQGDREFLAAAASSVATVTFADGTAEEAEKDAAAKALINSPTISKNFDHMAIQGAIDDAMSRAPSRAGKMENIRAIQRMASRPKELREDILLYGADVADVEKHEGKAAQGIGPDEHRALSDIAAALGLKLADYGIEKTA